MGLDMYLYRREYLSGYSFDENYPSNFRSVIDALNIEPCLEAPHVYADVCVAYWRKANAIHKWFCDLDGGRDVCQKIYVSRGQLIELRNLCDSVLLQPAIAQDVLPPQAGFFFGSYDIDEWYMEDMRKTITQLDKIIGSVPENSWTEFIYRASW